MGRRKTIKQAVILAAGKGSRLHPITTNRPKAMLPILGKPIIERVMEALKVNGIDDFILVVGQGDRNIKRYFQRESQIDVNMRFVHQPERLGMADALRWAAPLIDNDFVLSACDNLIPGEDIGRMLSLWRSNDPINAILTLLPIEYEKISSAGIVSMDGEWVTAIIEKPSLEQAPTNIASLPLYCLPNEILGYLPEVPLSHRGEYELQDAIQLLINRRGGVRGLKVNNRLTLTRPSDLLDINLQYLQNDTHQPQLQPLSVGDNTKLITPLFIEQDTSIGNNCTIGPNVYIERGSTIGDGSIIKDAIILCGSRVINRSKIVDLTCPPKTEPV